jgi:flagellar hook-basal body complex protein FliE
MEYQKDNQMNIERRNRLASIADNLQKLHDAITSVQSEEQETFDNLPEAFQQGEKGQASEATIAAMDEALDALSTAIASINTARE